MGFVNQKGGVFMAKLIDRVRPIPDHFFPLPMARLAFLMKTPYYRVRKATFALWPRRPPYTGVMKDEALKIAELIEARPIGTKAVRHMGSSFYVALPSSWVTFNGLDKGGRVYVHVTDRGEVMVSTKGGGRED